MKAWNTPAMEAFEISNTAAGGHKASKHDGLVYSLPESGLYVEEYYPSGESASDNR